MTRAFWWDGAADRLAHAFTESHARTVCGRWPFSSLFTPRSRFDHCGECLTAVRG